jgi:flagellar basal-body rod modification protein FlgD
MDVSTLLNTGTSTAAKQSDAAQKAQENQDRFLTLLVAQMKNQDPMSPMENAQLTSQIAQIQTVTGIDQLKTSIETMNAQFNQNASMQGVALIGRDVTTAGNRLQVGSEGAVGTFSLVGAADNVTVTVTTAAGTVIDTVQLGAATAGRHSFAWSKEGYSGTQDLRFTVAAKRGATPVSAQTFSRDRVVAVNTDGAKLSFMLASGNTTTLDSILSVD